jgi:hypothetical protein
MLGSRACPDVIRPTGHGADEVQAAHSSTVGQLDDNELL